MSTARTGFDIYCGNRLEILLEKLAEVTGQPLSSPFQAETIIVQSRGMQRFLSLELARRRGISANNQFKFPGQFLQELYGEHTDAGADYAYDIVPLTFRIMKLLPRLLRKPEFHRIKHYLTEESNIRLFRLSREIADVFDGYIVHRSGMLADWARGNDGPAQGDESWQPLLWRTLLDDAPDKQPLDLLKQLEVKLSVRRPDGFPERLVLFGITALPEMHRRIFEYCARIVPVSLFYLAPVKSEFFGRTHEEGGSELLRSFGRAGSAYLDYLNTRCAESPDMFRMTDLSAPGRSGTILSRIQRGILENSADSLPGKREVPPEEDESLQVHSCHTAMREVEVLYDQLLYLFETRPELNASDVVVLTPDIESYGPLIEAVFSKPEKRELAIPYFVADSFRGSMRSLQETLYGLFDASRSRLTTRDVLSLLEKPMIMETFGFSQFETELIRHWIHDTNIRWGIDAEHRGELTLPEVPENTWRSGLDRLLLGWVMPSGGQELYGDILPYDEIEGETALTLGRFMEFFASLKEYYFLLRQRRKLDEWATVMKDMILCFSGRKFTDFPHLDEFIQELEEIGEQTGFIAPVEAGVVESRLRSHLEGGKAGRGFLQKGVTLGALLPMRSIPFKVVCLLGMNEGVFPASQKTVDFNLLYRNPDPWTPLKRNEDRQLFLETILSARDVLYISYIGQDIHTNRKVHPSVVVAELLNAVEDSADGEEARRWLMREHRLQPFHPEYFKTERAKGQDKELSRRLFSYSILNLEGARSLGDLRLEIEPFIKAPLSLPEESFRKISLSRLFRFFRNPSEYLLKNRLEVYLELRDSHLEETEPTEPNALEAFMMRGRMADLVFAGKQKDMVGELLRAEGVLPAGAPGSYFFRKHYEKTSDFLEKLSLLIKEEGLEEEVFEMRFGDFELGGSLTNITSRGLVFFRQGRLRAVDFLQAWIAHLVLHNLENRKIPAKTICAGVNKTGELELYLMDTLDNKFAVETLQSMLELYWTGLREPLCFFPETSWLQSEGAVRGEPAPLRRLQEKWLGSYNMSGEQSNPYYYLCFRDAEPYEKDSPYLFRFEKQAALVFEPLRKNLREMSAREFLDED